MDIAQRDQYLASYADNAWAYRAHLEALMGEGFSREEALQLMVAAHVRDAGIFQANAVHAMMADMRRMTEGE